MPVNPDDYRKYLAGENLTPDHETEIIHSVAAVLEGLIDRRMHALEQMRLRANRALIDETRARNAVHSQKKTPNKEET